MTSAARHNDRWSLAVRGVGFGAVDALPDGSAVVFVTTELPEDGGGPPDVVHTLLRWDVGGEAHRLADDVRAVAW